MVHGVYTYLIRSLRDISLKHESLLDFMKNSLRFVESSSVDTDCLSASLFANNGRGRRHTIKSTRNSFLDSLANVLSLEVDGDNLRTDGFSHSESGGDCIDCVDFGCSLEDSPFDGAELGSVLSRIRSSGGLLR